MSASAIGPASSIPYSGCDERQAIFFCNRCTISGWCGDSCHSFDRHHEAYCLHFTEFNTLLAVAVKQLDSDRPSCRIYTLGNQQVCIFNFPKSISLNQAPLDGKGVAYATASIHLKGRLLNSKLPFNRFLGGDRIFDQVARHKY